ncbi:Histidine kinase [compost metagenome]
MFSLRQNRIFSRNLPFFQKMLYFWIPLLSVAVVTGYILYLQRFLFRPLARLVGGMRKLGYGMLDVRLPAQSDVSEFSIMTKTFNQMARQIEALKIDVYEEQLRVQKAEYKHLQMQINPNFYMNTLNLIYKMAALKDFKSVQKMSLHLADYFRFLMHGNRTTISRPCTGAGASHRFCCNPSLRTPFSTA